MTYNALSSVFHSILFFFIVEMFVAVHNSLGWYPDQWVKTKSLKKTQDN